MAEYTEEQLKNAARRAYEDGNVAAAQRFIAQARQVASSQPAAAATPTPAPVTAPEPTGARSERVASRRGSDRALAARATAQGIGNGLSLGLSDEILGAVAGVKGLVSGDGFSAPYQQERDAVRNAKSTIEEAYPTAYGAGEILGAVPASAAAGAAAGTGATALRTGARLAGVGAVEGGVIGAGNADGDGVVSSGLGGAAIGAAGGFAAKPIADGAQLLGRTVASPFSGLFNAVTGRGSQTRANAIAQRALSRSGRSLEDIQAEATAAQAAGQPLSVADLLGSPGQGALTGVGRQPGQAQREITEALEARQLNAGDRMSQALADNLGVTGTANQRRASMTANRSATADANYSAARQGADAVDVRGALGVLDTRLGQTAGMEGTGFAGDGIDSTFSRFRNRLAADRVPSDVDAIELSDFDRVLGVKQDMQDSIEAARRAGRNNEARELSRVVSELDRALEASSGSYRAANDTFAQQSRAIEAIDQGQTATRPGVRAQDSIDVFSGLDTDAQQAFRSGVGDSLLKSVENQAPGANVALPLMRDRTSSLLDATAGNPTDLRSFIGRENTMAETRNRVLGGSRTADNMANMDDVQNVDAGLIANLVRGRFTDAATQGAQKVANVATNQTEGTNQLLARILMSQDPKAAFSPVVRQQERRDGRSRVAQALLRQILHQNSGEIQQAY